MVDYPLLQEEPGAELRAYFDAKTRHAIFFFDADGALVKQLPDVRDAATAAGIAAFEAELRAALSL